MNNKKNIVFVVNPISGTSGKRTIVNQIDKYIDNSIFDFKIVYTEYKGHASDIAALAAKKGVDIVCAIGGDGTVNEVASALIHTDTALAIIPCGSGNGLARHLRIPGDAIRAIKTINSCKPIKIDYGIVNDHPFFCTCGVGLDAFVSQKFAECGKRGFLSYIEQVLKHALKYNPESYVLDVVNEESSHVEYKAALIACANASQYGNNVYIAPGASVLDGLLDVIIVEPYKMLDATQMGIQIMNGTLHKNKHIKRFKCKCITIKRKEHGPIHYDGDPMTTGDVIKVEIVPRGLKVICSGKEGIRKIGDSLQNTVKMYFNNIYMKSGQFLTDSSNKGKQILGIKNEKNNE